MKENEILYDLTHFDSKIYDVQFTSDCSKAVVFMETSWLNPVERKPSGSKIVTDENYITVIMKLDLTERTEDIKS